MPSPSPSPSPIPSPSPSPVDSLLSHAQALAAALQAEFPTVTIGGTSYPVTTCWTDLPEVDIADDKIHNPLVWVLDISETLGAKTSIPTYDEREILVVVQMKVEVDQSADAAIALSALCSQIARFLLPRDEAYILNEAVCATVRRSAKRIADWANLRYYCEIVSTWRM
jgi:hypothetical protein